jgi:GNAT superfamily N-acetyltransferase
VSALQVRPFERSDVAAAADLLAARFAAARMAESAIAPSAYDTSTCRAALAALVENRLAEGALASFAGRPIGFWIGLRNLPAPEAAAAYFGPAHSVGAPLYAHACAAGEDALAVYRALYAFLAERWVAEGFFTHTVGALEVERDVHDAFVTLGFGRHFTCALRGVEPLAEPTRADLEIRTATEADHPDVFELLAEQRAFHARAPMFLPNLSILRPALEAQARWVLSQPRCPTFVAYRDGRALGMMLFAPHTFVSKELRDDATVYLFQGVVRASERGGGVGAALLQHALAWMRADGLTRCALHYLSANPSGSVFWPSHGFRPVEHFLTRTVDARMAWSGR